jgi:hypothetical protein
MHIKKKNINIHQKMSMIWSFENMVDFKTLKNSYLFFGLGFFN